MFAMATNPWFDRSEPPASDSRAGQDPQQASSKPGHEPPQAAAPDVVLVAFATGRLAAGRRPEQAYLDVIALGADRRLAAIAVCAAAGTPWAEARTRMAAFDDIWSSLGSGSPETAGSLLELYGFFDVEVALDPDEAQVATFLRQAMATVAYLPSGYANGLYRMLRTGRLREALLSLEEMGAKRWADNRDFWLGLTEAAARLDSASILDTEVAAAHRRCASRIRS